MAKVIALKSLVGLAMMMFFSAQTCEEKPGYQVSANNIQLEIPMFPSQFSTHYVMDADVMYVHLINRITKTDSVINQAKMDADGYKKLQELINALDETEYINKCVSDGQSYTVILNEKDKDQVKVRFENTYHENLEQIINQVNSRLDKEDQIYFSKETLTALPTDCD